MANVLNTLQTPVKPKASCNFVAATGSFAKATFATNFGNLSAGVLVCTESHKGLSASARRRRALSW